MKIVESDCNGRFGAFSVSWESWEWAWALVRAIASIQHMGMGQKLVRSKLLDEWWVVKIPGLKL
jgi:VCBS repeat-containing protein